jgi:hypothetical protein
MILIFTKCTQVHILKASVRTYCTLHRTSKEYMFITCVFIVNVNIILEGDSAPSVETPSQMQFTFTKCTLMEWTFVGK